MLGVLVVENVVIVVGEKFVLFVELRVICCVLREFGLCIEYEVYDNEESCMQVVVVQDDIREELLEQEFVEQVEKKFVVKVEKGKCVVIKKFLFVEQELEDDDDIFDVLVDGDLEKEVFIKEVLVKVEVKM